jgi:hypothetical protein
MDEQKSEGVKGGEAKTAKPSETKPAETKPAETVTVTGKVKVHKRGIIKAVNAPEVASWEANGWERYQE